MPQQRQSQPATLTIDSIVFSTKRAFQDLQFLMGFFFAGGSASMTCMSGPVVLGVIDWSVTMTVAPGVITELISLTNSAGILIRAIVAGSESPPASPMCPGTPILSQ